MARKRSGETMPHRSRPRNGHGPPPPNRYGPSPRPVAAFGVADAEYGRLEQRVYGLEAGLQAISGQMDRDREHFDNQFSSLQTVIQERSKTQWPTLISAAGVLLGVMIALGGLAYMPIKSTQEDLKESMKLVAGTIVPRHEHQERWRTTELAIEALRKDVKDNQDRIVPRGEHQEQWASQRTRDAAMSDRIDAIAKSFGETYSLKDALKSMQERLDRIEVSGRAKS